jgi:hypothetical protein
VSLDLDAPLSAAALHFLRFCLAVRHRRVCH